jgi:UDP-N-acetylmuramate dehydrogenase
MIVDNNVEIKNSLGAPSRASFVVRIEDSKSISEVVEFAYNKSLPLIVLGSGTNIIPSESINAVVLYLENNGIEVKEDSLTIEAGEDWDNVVDFAVSNGFCGIEALSWIPGKAGSAPIQNIGAYGKEVSDVIEKVYVFNRQTKKFEVLSKEQCDFSYRNSIFKKYPDKYIVTKIEIKLNKIEPKIPEYKDVLDYFKNKKIENPTLKEIRKAIIEIRKSKLPDYNQTPNAGSYFTNPIIDSGLLEKILPQYPDIPNYKLDDRTYKIPAGWLIEKSGLKGEWVGELQTFEKNALVLTNPKRTNFLEILKAEEMIKEKVFENFGIKLEREPILI